MIGPERKSRVITDNEKRLPYHEAGHAIVAHFSTKIDPVQKISQLLLAAVLAVTP